MTDRTGDNDNEVIDELAEAAAPAQDTASGDNPALEISRRDEPTLPTRQA